MAQVVPLRAACEELIEKIKARSKKNSGAVCVCDEKQLQILFLWRRHVNLVETGFKPVSTTYRMQFFFVET